jgi:hypothetical protein
MNGDAFRQVARRALQGGGEISFQGEALQVYRFDEGRGFRGGLLCWNGGIEVA